MANWQLNRAYWLVCRCDLEPAWIFAYKNPSLQRVDPGGVFNKIRILLKTDYIY